MNNAFAGFTKKLVDKNRFGWARGFFEGMKVDKFKPQEQTDLTSAFPKDHFVFLVGYAEADVQI